MSQNTFNTLQAIRVIDETSPHHGEAGTVRSTEKESQLGPMVEVVLDGNPDEVLLMLVADLRAL